jgi:L-threonylcarbamoyladenylate synthase
VIDPVEALQAGKPIVLPTDTVYGLAVTASRPEPTERLYRLKGRDPSKPSALLAADLDMLFECVPELAGGARVIAGALLPGPYTLILPNPARRYGWITGTTPDAIGVRVPVLPEVAKEVVEAAGCVVATSANLTGGPEPRRVADVSPELLAACGAVVDAGDLPGTPSTVIDFTGEEPRVLREGAASSQDALARVQHALA